MLLLLHGDRQQRVLRSLSLIPIVHSTIIITSTRFSGQFQNPRTCVWAIITWNVLRAHKTRYCRLWGSVQSECNFTSTELIGSNLKLNIFLSKTFISLQVPFKPHLTSMLMLPLPGHSDTLICGKAQHIAAFPKWNRLNLYPPPLSSQWVLRAWWIVVKINSWLGCTTLNVRQIPWRVGQGLKYWFYEKQCLLYCNAMTPSSALWTAT